MVEQNGAPQEIHKLMPTLLSFAVATVVPDMEVRYSISAINPYGAMKNEKARRKCPPGFYLKRKRLRLCRALGCSGLVAKELKSFLHLHVFRSRFWRSSLRSILSLLLCSLIGLSDFIVVVARQIIRIYVVRKVLTFDVNC